MPATFFCGHTVHAYPEHTPTMRQMVTMVEAEAPPLNNLKKLALSQANAAAATIVETNSLLDPNARACVDCKPTQTALKAQSKSLLPVGARARVAKARLWGAKQLLMLLSKPALVRTVTVALSGVRKLFVAYVVLCIAALTALVLPGVPTVAAPPSPVGSKVLALPLLLFEVEIGW